MGEIRVCGLGIEPREDITLETVLALKACRTVFSDVADPKTYGWLGTFCRDLRRPRDAAEVVAAAKAQGTVGLAVWSHPHSSSMLARRVQALAAKTKTPCRVYAGISPHGSVLCRSVVFLGGKEGMNCLRSCELETLLMDPRLLADEMPLVVFSESAPARRWAALHDVLRKHYPADHELSLHTLGSPGGVRLPLKDLAKADPGGAVIYVPRHES